MRVGIFKRKKNLIPFWHLLKPPEFASGAVQSLADKNFCLDVLNRPKNEPIGIYYCAPNKVRPQDNQHLTLRYYRDIALPNNQMVNILS